MQPEQTRRSFLFTTGSAIVLSACSQQTNAQSSNVDSISNEAKRARELAEALEPLSPDDIDMAELMAQQFSLDPSNNVLIVETAPLEGATGDTAAHLRLAKAELAQNPDKRWFYWPEDDAVTFDYAHLAGLGPTVTSEIGEEIPTGKEETPFDLTPEAIQRMVSANYFDHRIEKVLSDDDRTESRVVIALRGARIADGEKGQNGFVRLVDIRPDHRNPRCVFISWNRAAETPSQALRAYPGSTVPSEIYLAAYQALGSGYKSCMMPQGLHLREVGTMFSHSNTLRQSSKTPVIREPSPDRDFYSHAHSRWDPESTSGSVNLVGAHIHCAYWDARDDRVWKFSSAGCQTICGYVKDDDVYRDIGDFYQDMAIPEVTVLGNNEYTSDKYNTTYPMVLLTGTEARLHARGADLNKMRRIRIGSSADIEANPEHPVVKVQAALGFEGRGIDGDFGGGSMLRLVEVQRGGNWIIGYPADGILTPELAAAADIELV